MRPAATVSSLLCAVNHQLETRVLPGLKARTQHHQCRPVGPRVPAARRAVPERRAGAAPCPGAAAARGAAACQGPLDARQIAPLAALRARDAPRASGALSRGGRPPVQRPDRYSRLTLHSWRLDGHGEDQEDGMHVEGVKQVGVLCVVPRRPDRARPARWMTSGS